MHLVYEYQSDEDLFQALWAESGAVQPLGWIDAPYPQSCFDSYVAALNCSNAQDALDCIRKAPVEAVTDLRAVSAIGRWSPHVDGVTIPDFPQKMIRDGRHARVPTVAGVLHMCYYDHYFSEGLIF